MGELHNDGDVDTVTADGGEHIHSRKYDSIYKGNRNEDLQNVK